MTDSKDLGADLGYLWDCGHVHLPRMADNYGKAAGMIHAGAAYDSLLFLEPGSGGRTGPVAALYQEFRDRLQEISADACVNIRDTGEALVRIANWYHAEDVAAHNELAEHVATTDFDDEPPDSIPDPPRPGDPYAPAPPPSEGL